MMEKVKRRAVTSGYAHAVKKNLVVSAGIAGTQKPWMVRAGYIPVSWMPAIHAGMTAQLNGIGVKP